MSWIIGTLTLPKSPERVYNTLPAIYENFPITGSSPDILGAGLNEETLDFTLALSQPGYSLIQLDGTYIVPLKSLCGSIVAVSTPFASMNGTYLCVNVSPDYDNATPTEIRCIINFVKGGTVEVL